MAGGSVHGMAGLGSLNALDQQHYQSPDIAKAAPQYSGAYGGSMDQQGGVGGARQHMVPTSFVESLKEFSPSLPGIGAGLLPAQPGGGGFGSIPGTGGPMTPSVGGAQSGQPIDPLNNPRAATPFMEARQSGQPMWGADYSKHDRLLHSSSNGMSGNYTQEMVDQFRRRDPDWRWSDPEGLYPNKGPKSLPPDLPTHSAFSTGPGPIRHNFTSEACFTDGVKVELADGSEKNVSKISVGDVVKTNEGEGSVVKIFHGQAGKQKLYGFNGKEPFATEAHPFMTQHGWKKVSELEIGDTLYRNGLGKDIVKSIQFIEVPEDTPVYNFHVDTHENYFADGYLVHNKRFVNPGFSPPDRPPRFPNRIDPKSSFQVNPGQVNYPQVNPIRYPGYPQVNPIRYPGKVNYPQVNPIRVMGADYGLLGQPIDPLNNPRAGTPFMEARGVKSV